MPCIRCFSLTARLVGPHTLVLHCRLCTECLSCHTLPHLYRLSLGCLTSSRILAPICSLCTVSLCTVRLTRPRTLILLGLCTCRRTCHTPIQLYSESIFRLTLLQTLGFVSDQVHLVTPFGRCLLATPFGSLLVTRTTLVHPPRVVLPSTVVFVTPVIVCAADPF